jgi:dihydrofolate reductase
MAEVRLHISISLDGFVAGPSQSEENPLGEGGMQLHEWAFALAAWREPHEQEGGEVNASTEVVEEMREGVGATLMGRNMFGGGPGPWGEDPWNGWWGDEPPFRMPVFVLTHHPREPLELGETKFTFITEGIVAALEQARAAAGERHVAIGGGSTARQYLDAGLIDEINLSVVPVLLGSGARLFDEGAGTGTALEIARVIEAPGVTHLRYRAAGGGRG